MNDTREKILLAALRLFARDGYEAVSVSDIAAELGITKAALYKHYTNKRDIFNSILARMEERDAEEADGHGLPTGPASGAESAYRQVSLESIIAFSKDMFRYWTEDEFAASFRKILMLEQFRDPGMAGLYRQYLTAGPVGYVTDMFAAMGLPQPHEKAIELYAPMFLSYSLYDGADDPSKVTADLDQYLDHFLKKTAASSPASSGPGREIVFRRETPADHRAVEELVRDAFWNVYHPGCTEHYVLHRLRSDPAFVPELDIVMERDGVLIGQNMFMRAVIHSDDGREIPIMTMGPICVDPALKRRGYGLKLLAYSLEQAAALGCGALCFEGNIRFYGRSGFTYAREFGIRYHGLPEGADASFFLCKELIPGYLDGVTGEYAPPAGYFAAEQDPEDFARFDATFPPREKKVLPGQLS